MNWNKRLPLALAIIIPLFWYINILSNKTTEQIQTPEIFYKENTRQSLQTSETPSTRNEDQKPPTQECNIPKLNPFDKSILPFWKNISLPACSESAIASFQIATLQNGILTSDCPNANYTAYDFGKNDYNLKTVAEGPLSSPVEIKTDFVRVNCGDKRMILSQVVRDENAVAQSRKLVSSDRPLNIIIIGFDSTSRASYERNLPLLQSWFAENTQHATSLDDLSSKKRTFLFKMNGYMVAGDGTTAQLQAMLTGRSSNYLPEARNGIPGSRPLDDWPFIFKNITSQGYITAYAEDQPGIGAFTFRLNGFTKKPTTHYMFPFLVGSYYPPCIGRLSEHQMVLNWTNEFLQTYREEPKFVFAYSKVSHDNTNYIQVADNDIVNFLEKLKETNILDNSMVVLFGDHGTRFEGLRLTKQGKIEERMPLNFVLFPRWYLSQNEDHYANLLSNQNRLITPYDYHATFLHIVYRRQGFRDMEYQYSLFEDIPTTRTCKEANVNEHHCICYKKEEMDVDDDVLIKGTEAVLGHLNSIVQEDEHARSVCEELEISKINYVEKLDAKPDPLYQVQFVVTPGPSTFEGTFRVKNDGEIEVIPDYSRVTAYVGGNCGVKTHIMRVCYCKK